MAIKTWQESGKTFYQVKVTTRSKSDRSFRVQRQEKGYLEETDPEVLRKKLSRIEFRLSEEARREVMSKEGAGITWGDLVNRWHMSLEEDCLQRKGLEGIKKPVKISTARAYVQALNDFTDHWFKRPASEITPADLEDVIIQMNKDGYSRCSMYNAKLAINRCFKWGIARRLIPGVTQSPCHGFGISRKESKRPEIHSTSQTETLMSEAYRLEHPWRQVWKGAYFTGGRSGELFQLKRKHLDLDDRLLTFEEKYNFQTKKVEPLKDEEWRQVPINDDLMELLQELKVHEMNPEDFIFPRLAVWKYGQAARVLREFCEQIKLPSICFHTLRACFATHLIRNGVNRDVVQKLGGWADSDTMQRYIRYAAIEIHGSTDTLSLKKRERPVRVLKLLR